MQDFSEIFQEALALHPWASPATARLPGVNLLDWSDWIWVDSAFAGQMAYREHLIDTRRDAVFMAEDEAEGIAAELLGLVLQHLPEGYRVDVGQVTRPDGATVPLKGDHPLLVLGKLVQQDFCILQSRGEEHVLTAANLCFPSSWSLASKFGLPMTAIHEPVPDYTENLAARVQRMFDRMHVDRPMWRANYLLYHTPDLFQPERRDKYRSAEDGRRFVRCERQSLVLLPQSRAIVFGIHTMVVPETAMDAADFAGLEAAVAEKDDYES